MKSDLRITSFRQELKVLAVMVVFVLILEGTARVLAPHLDYDRKHISQFDEIVSEMPAVEKRQDGHLVILGNSLLMHGFDVDLFHESLPDVELTKLTPVGTAIHDWEMIFKRYLENEGALPKHIVIGFVAHHINDSEPVKLRRMARHFANVGDLPYLWKHEHFNFHQKVQSGISHYSALLGDQPEYRLHSLGNIIPQYRAGLNANKDFVQSALKHKKSTQAEKPEFQRLERFLESGKKHGIEVYLVPMPQPKVWSLDPEIEKIAESYGVKVLDARQIQGMIEIDFSDGYHLGDTGRVKFTNWLADQFNTLGIYGDE